MVRFRLKISLSMAVPRIFIWMTIDKGVLGRKSPSWVQGRSTIHFPILDQRVSRWGAKRRFGGLAPEPMPGTPTSSSNSSCHVTSCAIVSSTRWTSCLRSIVCFSCCIDLYCKRCAGTAGLFSAIMSGCMTFLCLSGCIMYIYVSPQNLLPLCDCVGLLCVIVIV